MFSDCGGRGIHSYSSFWLQSLLVTADAWWERGGRKVFLDGGGEGKLKLGVRT